MLEDTNPFVYSRPIAPDDVIDREAEIGELLEHVVGGHYVRLYAPRKFGKTSLLRRALRDGEREEGLIPVIVDLYRVLSIADVAVRFERAYSKQLRGAIRSRIEEFFQKSGLGLSLGAMGISAKLQLGRTVDPLPALHALLELPLRLEEGGGYRAFIVLDEFQDVSRIADLDGLMRSHIQHHGDVASYVFAGSEPGLMRQLFEDKDSPLYGSAVPMRLGRLAGGDIAAYVAERFERTGKGVGEALNPLVDAADGHPQRAMLLAFRLWRRVEPGARATLDDWAGARRDALEQAATELDARWSGFGTTEQKAMRAVVAGEGSALRAGVLDRLALSKPTAQHALRRLRLAGEIEDREQRLVIVDPFFAEWIRRLDAGQEDVFAG